MAIDGPNTNNNFAQQTTQQPALQDQAVNQNNNQQNNGRPSFSRRDLLNQRLSPFGSNPKGIALIKMSELITELLKTDKGRYQFSMIPVDHTSVTNIAISCIVLLCSDKENKAAGTAFHVLMLADSISPIPPRYNQMPSMGGMGNSNVEIVQTETDLFDDTLHNTIRNVILSRYPNLKLTATEAQVIPRGFDYTDTDRMTAVVANAAEACATRLSLADPEFRDLNIKDISQGRTLQLRTFFKNTPEQDIFGLPVRADITMDLTESRPQDNTGNMSLNLTLESALSLCKIAAYLDLVYMPPAQVNNIYLQQQPNLTVQQLRRYQPHLIITQMDKMIETLPMQLVSLGMAVHLMDNSGWLHALKPRDFVKGQINPRDIGALNIEANLGNDPNGGQRLITDSATFGDREFGNYVSALIHSDLMISMDVGECGPDKWYNTPFALAGGNSEKREQGAQAIINAADALTNNEFSKVFTQMGGTTATICSDENNRIILGYYVDSQGNKRDIRDLDYLAFMNRCGEQDMQAVWDYSQTHLQTSMNVDVRLAKRIQLCRALVGDFVITGKARRITFHGKFLLALATAMRNAGLNIRPVASNDTSVAYERATGESMRFATLGNQSTGLFNMGSPVNSGWNSNGGNSWGY